MDVLGFFNSVEGNLVLVALGLVGVRTALGIFAAANDGTFTLSAIASFVRSQVLGRVFPFATVAYFSFATGNLALLASAGAIGAAFVAESIGAIQESISAGAKAEAAKKAEAGVAMGNPVPQD